MLKKETLEILKNIRDEITCLQLKKKVIQEDEYVKRLDKVEKLLDHIEQAEEIKI